MINNHRIIDFHSHMLPAIDDGSKSLVESEQMLLDSLAQGIDEVYFTPHFYAERDDFNQFLSNRETSYSSLTDYLSKTGKKYPKTRLGCEVAYYSGINHSKLISRLKAENTDILLVEMPFCKWNDGMINEIVDMLQSTSLIPCLAHIERYLDYVSMSNLKRMLKSGVLLQINAEFILDAPKHAYKMFKKGMISFLGSDAHNTTGRRQKLGEAINKFFEYDNKLADLFFNYSNAFLKQ